MEFWYGMSIYMLVERAKNSQRFTKSSAQKIMLIILLLIGFVLSYLSIYTHDENDRAYIRFITYGLPSFLIVFAAVKYESLFVVPRFSLLHLVGDASFSIYLSHVITLHIFYSMFDVHRYHSFMSDSISFFLSIVVGVFVYSYVEKPIHNRTRMFCIKLEK